MTYEGAMKQEHAMDCPAGQNICELPGKTCDCGLELLRAQLLRRKQGYEAWLERKRESKGRSR
jgi:hypothetical protein